MTELSFVFYLVSHDCITMYFQETLSLLSWPCNPATGYDFNRCRADGDGPWQWQRLHLLAWTSSFSTRYCGMLQITMRSNACVLWTTISCGWSCSWRRLSASHQLTERGNGSNALLFSRPRSRAETYVMIEHDDGMKGGAPCCSVDRAVRQWIGTYRWWWSSATTGGRAIQSTRKSKRNTYPAGGPKVFKDICE